MLEKVKTWAHKIKVDLVALFIAARDERTPVLVKALCAAVVAYALSPIDLIPDFIPVVGYLDDLLIVPLGIALAVHLMPQSLMEEFRSLASGYDRLPKNRFGAMIVLWVWTAAIISIGWWVYRRDTGLQLFLD